MNIILFVSNALIPFLIFYVVCLGISMKLPVFDIFLEGVRTGLQTVLGILPTLIGLLTAVGVLRAADVFSYIGMLCEPLLMRLSIVPEILSLTGIKMFSSTAATGLMLDIFNQYGVDSEAGRQAALILSCTESSIYTMSVYFMSQKIEKGRWTLAGALIAALSGVVLSILLTKITIF